MIVSSRNPGFIRTMFWKAAMARDRVYSLCVYVPQAAKDRFDEIERRLRSIRSTQPNLWTQVRLGENDFDIRCKYINTGGKEIYEKYPLDKLDPEETLPPILCKGAKIPLATQRYLIKANEKLNDAEKKELLKKSEEHKEGETDEDGFRTEKKRKARSPAGADRKNSRKFSPQKIGRDIYKIIRLKEPATVDLDTNTVSDCTDDEDANKTTIEKQENEKAQEDKDGKSLVEELTMGDPETVSI